jgi:hypothetical protein
MTTDKRVRPGHERRIEIRAGRRRARALRRLPGRERAVRVRNRDSGWEAGAMSGEGQAVGGDPTRLSQRMADAGAAADRRLGDAPANNACATCAAQVRLEHRSQYTAMPRYSQQEWVPAARFIFLVGKDHSNADRRLSVRVAEPAGASATWEVTPIGAHSGTLKTSTGTGNRFDYTPSVTQAQRPITGSRTPNQPVQYRIKATITHDGKTQEIVETVAQDERDIIRQEYVDFRTWRAGFTLHVPYRNRIREPSRPQMRGNYTLVVDSAMTDLLTATEARYGGTITVSSGWRNPRRNIAAGSKVPNSNHQHGGAVDMQPASAHAPASPTRRHEYLNLYNAALGVSARMVLLERNSQALYPGRGAVPSPSPKAPDRDQDGIPDASGIQATFDNATHVHIDRAPPDEAEDD